MKRYNLAGARVYLQKKSQHFGELPQAEHSAGMLGDAHVIITVALGDEIYKIIPKASPCIPPPRGSMLVSDRGLADKIISKTNCMKFLRREMHSSSADT